MANVGLIAMAHPDVRGEAANGFEETIADLVADKFDPDWVQMFPSGGINVSNEDEEMIDDLEAFMEKHGFEKRFTFDNEVMAIDASFYQD